MVKKLIAGQSENVKNGEVLTRKMGDSGKTGPENK